jgi:hypothetical protein
MSRHELTGLYPTNPLGFLAALGLLKVLSWRAHGAGEQPTLHFSSDAMSTPILGTPLSFAEMRTAVLADAVEQGDCSALQLAYGDDGVGVAHTDADAIRDLKPAPDEARAFLERVGHSNPRSSAMAAGFFSELVQDNNGRTKPTAFHFTAGQQTFLSMVNELRCGITEEDIDEALLGPWKGTSGLPSLSWDSSATRYYAFRAGNPSHEKRGSVPAANWLALQALSFFPVIACRGRLYTTGVDGAWKKSVFSWPLWAEPLSMPVVASLVRSDIQALTARERTAFGVTQVLRSSIHRSDQGGAGSFAPSDVVPSRSADG